MAVEHKDDTQPIANKMKSLQEAEHVEAHANNGKPHDETENKENLNENGNNNNHNDHNDNNNHDTQTHITETNDDTDTQQDSQSENPVLEMEQLSVAEPSNFSVKHPLQNGWTIWYDNPQKRTNQASWGDHLKKITTFGTVEDFWRVFNNLKPASVLAQGSNYHIFKEHIEPKWEDSTNAKGGKWTVTIPPKSRSASLDQMWLWAVLACIGETFLSPDDVCGVVVSVRKAGDRVQIWTKDATNEQACRDIGRSLKDALELPDSTVVGYQSHADSMKKSYTKNRYEV